MASVRYYQMVGTEITDVWIIKYGLKEITIRTRKSDNSENIRMTLVDSVNMLSVPHRISTKCNPPTKEFRNIMNSLKIDFDIIDAYIEVENFDCMNFSIDLGFNGHFYLKKDMYQYIKLSGFVKEDNKGFYNYYDLIIKCDLRDIPFSIEINIKDLSKNPFER